ncbi:hypothetical protein L484_013702 [Morus notabilis]|uniref:Uncharacterized protein n=1 Tax=Morus notabilis TaxID=981085 RepID=W9QFP2_9ROSA|nr:hypothetical protein L484_013702 [Morus notabilis]
MPGYMAAAYWAQAKEDMDNADRILDGEEDDDDNKEVIAPTGRVDPLGNICQYTGGVVSGCSAYFTSVNPWLL